MLKKRAASVVRAAQAHVRFYICTGLCLIRLTFRGRQKSGYLWADRWESSCFLLIFDSMNRGEMHEGKKETWKLARRKPVLRIEQSANLSRREKYGTLIAIWFKIIYVIETWKTLLIMNIKEETYFCKYSRKKSLINLSTVDNDYRQMRNQISVIFVRA